MGYNKINLTQHLNDMTTDEIKQGIKTIADRLQIYYQTEKQGIHQEDLAYVVRLIDTVDKMDRKKLIENRVHLTNIMIETIPHINKIVTGGKRTYKKILRKSRRRKRKTKRKTKRKRRT